MDLIVSRCRLCMVIALFIAALAAFHTMADDLRYINIYSNDGVEKSIDLDKYNRITFDDNYITFSNIGDSDEVIKILYEEFNAMAFDAQAFDDTLVAVNEVQSPFRCISYDAQNQRLFVGDIREIASIGIFDSAGKLTKTGTVNSGDSIDLTDYQPGIYIVILHSTNNTQHLKISI